MWLKIELSSDFVVVKTIPVQQKKVYRTKISLEKYTRLYFIDDTTICSRLTTISAYCMVFFCHFVRANRVFSIFTQEYLLKLYHLNCLSLQKHTNTTYASEFLIIFVLAWKFM